MAPQPLFPSAVSENDHTAIHHLGEERVQRLGPLWMALRAVHGQDARVALSDNSQMRPVIPYWYRASPSSLGPDLCFTFRVQNSEFFHGDAVIGTEFQRPQEVSSRLCRSAEENQCFAHPIMSVNMSRIDL